MEDNRNKLAERGEKLNQIQDKAARMEQDADNFAKLAAKLARDSEKKWWQI